MYFVTGSEDMHSNINICTAQINYRKEEMDNLRNMIVDGIKRGVVKPLYSTTYPHNKIKQAIQDMSRQNHIGKILIQVKIQIIVLIDQIIQVKTQTFILVDQIIQVKKQIIILIDQIIQVCNDDEDDHSAVQAIESVSCCPTKTYILVGGLGGFGLELANWLVEKGATKLILTSRSGVKTDYQSRKIKKWKNRNVDVTVSTHDAAEEKECRSLLEEAIKLGPVGGIFNLAAVNILNIEIYFNHELQECTNRNF
ncbi:hypothetical protein KUTeg_004538 [Tegillarca granosa]|uniref:Ketoreductase (KR) domain-containing protein n=1 Tax=Tegillarca granosa TaxID=220873 RepID=A0ABQ9FQ83_TEGGR|nr:hypothetical protein KUTeg_004538 [Tegillarca granosa]